MAGHSHFANIQHKKERNDAQKSKVFTVIQRMIEVAARSGSTDAGTNPKLRVALEMAKKSNFPKDRIQRIFDKVNGGDASEMFEIGYNATFPGGVMMIIDCLTDNRNRSASDVKSTVTKFGGNMVPSGGIEFNFNHIGYIEYIGANYEELFEIATDLGAIDIEESGQSCRVVTEFETFSEIMDSLIENKSLPSIESHGIMWSPKQMVDANEELQIRVQKIITVLEGFDDVQEIYHNVVL